MIELSIVTTRKNPIPSQKTLSINESIKNKNSFGGTSPQRVKQSIKYAIKKYL